MRALCIIIAILFAQVATADIFTDEWTMGSDGMHFKRSVPQMQFQLLPVLDQLARERTALRGELTRLREQVRAGDEKALRRLETVLLRINNLASEVADVPQLSEQLAAVQAAADKIKTNGAAMEESLKGLHSDTSSLKQEVVDAAEDLKQQVAEAATEATADRDAIDAALAELSSTMVRLENTTFARDLILRLAFADLQDEQVRQYEEYRAVLDALSQNVDGLAGVPAQLEAIMGRLASIETAQATPAIPVDFTSISIESALETLTSATQQPPATSVDLSSIEKQLGSIETALETPPAVSFVDLPGWDRWWWVYLCALALPFIVIVILLAVIIAMLRRVSKTALFAAHQVTWLKAPSLMFVGREKTTRYILKTGDGARYEIPLTRMKKEDEQRHGKGLWYWVGTGTSDMNRTAWRLKGSSDAKQRILEAIAEGKIRPCEV